MINRPRIKQIDKIDLLQPEKQVLSNGIPLYIFDGCPEDVSRIDFIFEAGVWHQSQPLVAHFTNQMLKEGTAELSSAEIAEKLDFYGSWLQLSNSYHQSFVTLYSLNKYLPQTLSLLEQMIKKSMFPENEFQTMLNNRKQNYIIDSEKVKVLATRRFQTSIYGKNHPYGTVSEMCDYESLTTNMLKDFYHARYHSANCNIILSGHVSKEQIQQVENLFGANEWGTCQHLSDQSFDLNPDKQKLCFIPKNDSVQSAVIIGRPLVNITHPDYHDLQVLNTIFGGYFGSRLMSNIREKKGYTYGISSGVASFLNAGHFSISSQTGTQFTQLLIDEVYHEMDKLCSKPVSANELKKVKSYMLGETVRNFDGVFALSDSFISLLANKLDYSFYEKNIESIKDINPQIIQKLAQQYFVKDDFYQIVSGKQE